MLNQNINRDVNHVRTNHYQYCSGSIHITKMRLENLINLILLMIVVDVMHVRLLLMVIVGTNQGATINNRVLTLFHLFWIWRVVKSVNVSYKAKQETK